MAFTRRTSSRACKEVAMARIVACLNSPQELEINLKNTGVLSSKSGSCLRPRRATCTGTLKSPVKKLSELCLSSPQRTPKSLSNASCLIKRRGDTLNTNSQCPMDSEDSYDESSSSTSESSFSTYNSSDSSDLIERQFQHRNRSKGPIIKSFPVRRTKLNLCANKSSILAHRKRTLSQVSRGESFLNLSSTNSEYGWLPGREQEFENIYTFILNKLSQNSGGCMYISGIPGTGKTASVQAVLSTMHKLVADSGLESQIPTFQVIYVNGMRVSDPKQVYVEIYEVSN